MTIAIDDYAEGGAFLQAVILKAKKLAKQSPAFKTEMEEFEEKLTTTAAERKEEEATAQVSALWLMVQVWA